MKTHECSEARKQTLYVEINSNHLGEKPWAILFSSELPVE